MIAAENGLDYARLGLAVSKRNVSAAVARNRVKRSIRESFRKNRAQLDGLDIVVVSQKRTVAADRNRLLNSLNKHWKAISK